MRRRPHRARPLHIIAMTAIFAISLVATLSWAWTGGVDQLGLPYGPGNDPTVTVPGRTLPPLGGPRTPAEPGASALPGGPGAVPGATGSSGVPGDRGSATSGAQPSRPGSGGDTADGTRSSESGDRRCRTGRKLVPTCGVLWGVAPGAFTDERGKRALAKFEEKTKRHQDVFHAYHRGNRQLFPTEAEVSIAREPGRERILFLNWKPSGASWARIAKGDRATDAFLDRLARHINQKFPEQFFFTVHHEAEDNVRERAGSGYQARDYAAMYRHVVERLRARGVDNLVTVLVHMAYVPHTSESWFQAMYPGDGVVDWIGFDTYAYGDPGYGHGDFAELLNRQSSARPNWPGFYNWATRRHPDKPLMVAEWGVWTSKRNPGHKAEFYREVGRQIGRFPNIRAMVHFDTPRSQKGRDSRVDATAASLRAYRELGRMPIFQVDVVPSTP
ncbi:glycosyl hydrolase [Actinoplanes sp. NPDC049118]|uniref:glycosyl hydrolase n=1 Tax=Actinoplanes sp. NPDC049118 TaxID=3155769 RepID=UPI0033C53F19